MIHTWVSGEGTMIIFRSPFVNLGEISQFVKKGRLAVEDGVVVNEGDGEPNDPIKEFKGKVVII